MLSILHNYFHCGFDILCICNLWDEHFFCFACPPWKTGSYILCWDPLIGRAVSKWVEIGKWIRRTYTISCYEFCGIKCLNFIFLYLSRLPCSFHIDFGIVKFKEPIFLVMFHPIPANVGSLVSSMTWIQRYGTCQLYFLLALHKFSLKSKSNNYWTTKFFFIPPSANVKSSGNSVIYQYKVHQYFVVINGNVFHCLDTD